MKSFVTVPLMFAGKYPVRFTIHAQHVSTRWKERGHREFKDATECALHTAEFFKDERLDLLMQWAPKGAPLALIHEPAGFVFFLRIGTAVDENEIKVSTLIPYVAGNRAMVDIADLCYILPQEGKLRFGKERKYFELKKRRP